jgi:alpha-beta hydrolase superfamily lysophospholipase
VTAPERVRIRRVEQQLAGADDLPLFRRAWLPSEPKRAVVVIHGFAEHSGRYEGLGSWFAERGHAVHAYDHRGHGHSAGERGHVERFSDFLDDAERMVEQVRREHPGLPLVLVGHSMGGLILAALLRERRPDVTAAVSSGAALALAERMPRAQVAAARLLRRLTPRLSIAAGLDVEGLSRDPEVIRRYVDDPLVFRRLTVSLAVELHDASRRTAEGGSGVQLPMLLLHGERDSLCPPEGSRRFHAAIPEGRSQLRVYPELRHEIFNEPEAEQVFRDALQWLDGLGI